MRVPLIDEILEATNTKCSRTLRFPEVSQFPKKVPLVSYVFEVSSVSRLPEVSKVSRAFQGS